MFVTFLDFKLLVLFHEKLPGLWIIVGSHIHHWNVGVFIGVTLQPLVNLSWQWGCERSLL